MFFSPRPVLAEDRCEIEKAPINLFQLHHAFDETGECLLIKTKAEPNYIAHGVSSDRTHLFEDQSAWQEFDYWRFCYDSENPEKLGALLEDLDENNLLSFQYRNLRHQFGTLNSLVYNISRQLNRTQDIRQNGVFYYGLFSETLCTSEDSSEEPTRVYAASELSEYEKQMESFYRLNQIFAEHFEAVERHSFLPSELEEMQ